MNPVALETPQAQAITRFILDSDSSAKLETELVAKYGDGACTRLQRGLRQVAQFWRVQDGAAPEFEDFVRANFAGDQATLDTMFKRLRALLFEQTRWPHARKSAGSSASNSISILDRCSPLMKSIGGYNPSAHVLDDFFRKQVGISPSC